MADLVARYFGRRRSGVPPIALERWSAAEAVLIWSACSAMVWAAVIGFLAM
jgi:hypothetical protein